MGASQRRGPRFELGAAAGKRFSPRWEARIFYTYNQRYGEDGPRVVQGISDDVFDQKRHAVTLSSSVLATERWLVTAGFTYQRGDFEAHVRTNRTTVLAEANVGAVARDTIFGGWVYRAEGNGYAPFASLNYGLDDRWSLDVLYRFRYAEGNSLSYRNHNVSLSLLFRY